MNYPIPTLYQELQNAVAYKSDEQIKEFENAVPDIQKKHVVFHVPKELQKLNFEDVAKVFNIKTKNKKMVCPFHKDKDPSLSFDNNKKLFHCFGCNKSGDIIQFFKLMTLKDEQRRSKT